MDSAQCIPETVRTLDELKHFVHITLCQRENILTDQFFLQEKQLVRGGKRVGLHFAVQGPRSLRLEAIWDAEHNQIFFYDAQGNRFLKLRLPQRLEAAA